MCAALSWLVIAEKSPTGADFGTETGLVRSSVSEAAAFRDKLVSVRLWRDWQCPTGGVAADVAKGRGVTFLRGRSLDAWKRKSLTTG